MTPELAAQWIAYAGLMSVDHVYQIGLDDHQLIALGSALASNPVINLPPRPRIANKTGEFVCACGCGERFTASYRTKRPKYKSEAHRQRYWRNKAKEKREKAQRRRRGTPAGLIRNGNGFKVARA